MKIVYFGLMVIAGMVIPVMASLNAALSMQLKSVSSAVLLFFLVALVAAAVITLPFQANRLGQTLSEINNVPRFYLLAGLGVVFYICSVSFVGPKLGMGASITCVLLGQLCSMVVIDHFALFAMPKVQISLVRVLGLVLMFFGAFLVLRAKG